MTWPMNWLLNYVLSTNLDEQKMSKDNKLSYHLLYEIKTTIIGLITFKRITNIIIDIEKNNYILLYSLGLYYTSL